MGQVEKTVFISYRRTNSAWALAIYQNLTANGYDVFFDYESINSGDFEQIILGNIRARAHFLVLLTPSALERCDSPDDWLRREIETALDEKRNIVPLFLEGFNFSIPSIATKLTGKMANLKNYNGLNIPLDYFKEAMARLQERFLNAELDTVLHPISVAVQEAVQQQQITATETEIKEKELLSVEWFEKGFNYLLEKRFEDATFCFNEVIRLTPDFPAGYSFRGQTLCRSNGNPDDAIKDFDKALSLDPQLQWAGAALQGRAQALWKKGDLRGALKDITASIHLMPDVWPNYFIRGAIYAAQGDLDNAIKDFNEGIGLQPDQAEQYYLRGTLYTRKQNFDSAIKDFNEAIRLQPDDPRAYDGRSHALHAKGDLIGALRDASEAVRLNPQNAAYYANRGNLQLEKRDLRAALPDLEKYIALGGTGSRQELQELERFVQTIKYNLR